MCHSWLPHAHVRVCVSCSILHLRLRVRVLLTGAGSMVSTGGCSARCPKAVVRVLAGQDRAGARLFITSMVLLALNATRA